MVFMGKSVLTRRNFLAGGIALATGVVTGACLRPQAASADVLRPPGALPEEGFMARCISCQRCVSACPEGVLRPLGIEKGIAAARTPEITYAEGSCTFCDECRKVCPTAAIGSVDPYAPQDGRIGVAVVREERCLAFPQTESCGICVDACPYGALSFDEYRQPVVEEKLCNGCGECVRICPANVLTTFGGGSGRGIEVITNNAWNETVSMGGVQ